MAGEWIKVELATPDKPEVLRIARLLGIDKDTAFGKLIRLWCWFDKNSVDGVVEGVVDSDVDAICFQTGFCCALVSVGWLTVDFNAESISIPKFDRHNGESAKKRALKNEAQAKWRANKDKNVDQELSTQQSTTVSTREEKRREDKSIMQDKPARKKSEAHSLPDDFTPNETCKTLASELGVSWEGELPKFRDHHLQKGTLGKDWNAGFRTWLNNGVKFGTAVKAPSSKPFDMNAWLKEKLSP